MTSFALDKDNNIIYNSSFIELSGADKIKQDIKTRLKMFIGENPFDKQDGFDYIENMKNLNTMSLATEIKEKLSKIDGISSFNISINNNQGISKITITTEAKEVINVY